MSLRLANLRRRLTMACVWLGSGIASAGVTACIGSGDDNASPSVATDASDAHAGDATAELLGHDGGDATRMESGGQDAGGATAIGAATAKNAPVLSLSDTKVDVGLVGCGSTPVTKILTITNTGGSSLSVQASKAGTAFSLSPTALTLSPGMSGVLTIAASVPSSATAGVPVAGSLALFTNDPSNTNVVLPLSATPIGATLMGASTFTFASTEVGTPAPPLSVRLQNIGNAAATFTFSPFSDPNVTFVTPPSSGGVTLYAGDTFASPVAFTPATTVPITATSTITVSHGVVCGPGVPKLTFTGVASTGTLQGWPSSGAIDFGVANCGGVPPASQIVTLVNASSTDVRISVDATSQLNGFTVTMGPKVPAGGTMTITLTAPAVTGPTPGNPTSLMPITGTLVLKTDGVPDKLTAKLGEQPQGAVLAFGGPSIPGCTTSANFGTFTGGVLLQPVPPQSFCVTNTGNGAANVTLVASESGSSDAGAPIDSGATVDAGADTGGIDVPPPFVTLLPTFTIPATTNASTPSVEQESLTFQPVHAVPTVGSLAMTVDSTTALCAVLPTSLPLSGSAIGGGPTITPTSLTFVATCGGDAPGSQTFVVSNAGMVNMTWAMSGLTGPGAAQYTVTTSQPPGLLIPGQSTTVTVNATKIPSPAPNPDPAALTAQLTITTDVPFDPSHVVTLTEVPLGDQLSVSVGTLRFGQVPIGTSVSQSFTVNNHANVGSQAQSANLSLMTAGDGASSYSGSQVTSGDLFAGHSAVYNLTFNSPNSNPSPATLVFSTTDALCTALPAPIVLSGTGTSGLVSLSASTLTFGAPGDANGFVNCGATGQPQTLTISNAGNQSFNVTAVSLGKGVASPFALSPVSPPVKVSIGGSATVAINPSIIPKVGVDPNDAAAFSDVLTIATDAAGDMPHTIPLVMQPRGAVISSATQPPTTWSFGTVGAGSIGTFLGTTIQNTGNLAATVTLQPSGTLSLPSVFGLQNNPVTAAPGLTALVGQFAPNLANSTWTGQGQLLVTAAAMCDNIPQPWIGPVVNFSGSSSSNPIVTISGSLVFPTSDCGGAPPGGQEVTITNGANQTYAYTAKFVSGTWYNLVDSGSGSLAANNIAKIVVNPKMVVPGAGVFPGSAPYADDLLISVATTPPTRFTVPISWTLNGAVLRLPKGAGPNTDSQGSFYVADGTSGFPLPMVNMGTASAEVSLALQPTGSFSVQPMSPIAVLPNITALPELTGGASAPACPTTSSDTATFVYSGPVCQPFPLASVNVRSCLGTYVGGGGLNVGDAGAGADAGELDGSADGTDAGTADAGGETQAADANRDASAGAPTACTGPNTPAGCLPCGGNASGVCTLTEALVLNYDIAKNGFTTTSATTKAASCYYCMVASACLDSAPKNSILGIKTQGRTGLECEDPLTATNVAANDPAECRDVLGCVLTSNHCSTSTPAMASTDPNASVSDCYCGTHLGSACTAPAPSGGPNGACKTNEEIAIGSKDPTIVLANFTDGTKSPGGVGNEILNCALTAACDICFN